MILEELRKLNRDLCPVGKALTEIGDKWVILILRECFFGFKQFEDFQKNLKISRSVLATKLNQMVKTNLLKKVAYKKDNQRARYEYSLTNKGMDLLKIFIAYFEWGNRHILTKGENSYELVQRNTWSPLKVDVSNELGGKIELKEIRLRFVGK